MAREKVEFDVVGRDNASRTFRDVGDAADKAGTKVDGLGKHSHDLDGEIKRLETSTRELIKQFRSTEDVEILKRFKKDRSQLNLLRSMKKELGDVADVAANAGQQGVRGFMDAFESLPMQVRGVAMATGAALTVAMAPVIGGVLSTAVIGGAGGAGIIGGVVAASRDPRVQQAGQHLADRLGEAFTKAGEPMVAPLIESFNRLEQSATPVIASLADGFAELAPIVPLIADGIGGLARNAMPGFLDAMEAAKPLLRALANELPEVGSAVSDFFSTISEDSDGAILGLMYLFDVFTGTLRTAGDVIAWLSARFEDLVRFSAEASGVLEDLVGWMPLFGDYTKDSNDRMERWLANLDKSKDSSHDFSGALKDLVSGFRDTGSAASDATQKIESYDAMMKRFAGENLSAREAQRGLEEAIDQATKSLKENGRTLDINTPKGRANQSALDAIAGAANRTYDATLKQTGSQVAATEAAQRGREEFVRLAQKLGLSRTAAEKLAEQLIGIPSDTKADVKSNAKTVAEQAAAVDRKLRDIENGSPYNAQVNVRFTEKGDRFGISGKAFKGQSHGGRVEGPGTDTSDDIIRRVSRGEYVIRAAAARAIGYDTLDALNQADRRPVAMTSAGSTSSAPVHGITAEDFYRAMVRAIQTLPIVRLDAGRTAGIYARGG